MLRSARRRAAKSGVPFSITLDDIVIPARCPALNIPLRVGTGRGGQTFQSPTLDRVVPELGYTPGNVMVISHRANTIKSSASPHELALVLCFVRRKIKGAI